MRPSPFVLLALTLSGGVQPACGAALRQAEMVMPPPPQRTGERADLPLQLIGGLPTITATVNGRGPFRFGVDTGAAGYLRVTPQLAEKLALARAGEVLATDPSGKNPVRVPLFRADSLKFGGLSFSNVVTGSLGLSRPGVDGIIGIGFFSNLLLTLDYGRLRFKVTAGSLPVANGKDVVDISLDRGMLPTVAVKVGSWTGNAHLDTGNTRYPFFVPAADISSLPTRGEARTIGVARTVNQQLELEAIDLNAPVLVGNVTLEATSVGFPSAGPEPNVGSLALEKLAVTVDSANRRLKLVPSP